jgi:hypothetical protein
LAEKVIEVWRKVPRRLMTRWMGGMSKYSLDMQLRATKKVVC